MLKYHLQCRNRFIQQQQKVKTNFLIQVISFIKIINEIKFFIRKGDAIEICQKLAQKWAQ